MPSISNTLYYGDNLDVLRRHIKDASVDLVYLDPPFNSNANYNVLFAAKDGTQAAAQIQVFEDTWRWDESAARQFAETVEAGGSVADVLLAFERFLGTNDMLAYLAMMAPRLVELRRILKPTGSLYLHCDSTASHYLKLLLDGVFGPVRYRNEIVWKRRTGSSSQVHRSNSLARPPTVFSSTSRVTMQNFMPNTISRHRAIRRMSISFSVTTMLTGGSIVSPISPTQRSVQT